MFKVSGAILCCGALLFCAGCGDDGDRPADQGALDSGLADRGALDALDAGAAPDADARAEVAAEHNMGEGCKGGLDCMEGSALCLLLSEKPRRGICTAECDPDDATTPIINEDSCPSGFVCATFRLTTAVYNFCLKKCTPDAKTNTCPASAKQTCHPASTRFGGTGQAVCWYLACEDGRDCPVTSATTCSGDSDCDQVGPDAYCDADTARCARPGNCGPSGLCVEHSLGKAGASVGDPCEDDFDCPGAGECFEEFADASFIGKGWANGYCTIMGCAFASVLPGKACPSGSTCHRLYYGGICAKTCALDDPYGCRGHAADRGGDYECYDWSRFVVGALPVADEPVCLNAAGRSCDSLGSDSDCSGIGDAANLTNMTCRDRLTGAAKADPQDPTGVCLDDSASGEFDSAPDGGQVSDPPDPDAGVADEA